MIKYIAIGLRLGSYVQMTASTSKEAAMNFTNTFGYDPKWIFTEDELMNSESRLRKAYK